MGKLGGNMANQDSGIEEKIGANMGPMGVRFKNGPKGQKWTTCG